MKIGIDLRFVGNDLYSKFVTELVETLINKGENNTYIIYGNGILENNDDPNVIIKNVNIKNGSLEEQTKFLSILNADQNNLMLFFNHYKPIFYKWQYITLIGSLKDIYYMNFKSNIEKYKYLFLMGKNLKKSYKIICLEENTIHELIEKFDINEKKIFRMNSFFPGKYDTPKEIGISINIKTKFLIKNDFFIYSAGDSIEKNYDRLVTVFKRLKEDGRKIDLVFLGHNISSNLNLRNLILEHDMQSNVYFLGHVDLRDKKRLYEEALGTIFPSFYEPFPFKLAEPLHFNSRIIASDLNSIKTIFGNKILYFSPISTNSIYDTINDFLDMQEEDKKIDYTNILSIYNKDNTCKSFIEIIT